MLIAYVCVHAYSMHGYCTCGHSMLIARVAHDKLHEMCMFHATRKRGALGVELQKFCTIKVMAADLQKCCSENDLPTAPWRFLLSFFLFVVLLYSFSKV